jgi:predicted ATPase
MKDAISRLWSTVDERDFFVPMNGQAVVARENELAQLEGYLARAIRGEGQICFVAGEAGSGKTALVLGFAQRVQEQHPELIVAMGNCNAQIGIGDPFLPFREILALLTGDEEAIAKRVVNAENAHRLKRLIGKSIQVLVEVTPELVETLVPGGLIIGALEKALAKKAGWTTKIEALTQRQRSLAQLGSIGQSRIFEQYTQFLRALAEGHPIMVVLDDLQWADAASTALLFHLSRRIRESRVLLVGTYRPVDVSLGRGDIEHPLASVLNECRRYLGDIFVNLDETDQAEKHRLVEALLDMQPNLLRQSFRDTVFKQTGGNPLFTIELLRDMMESGDLIQDAQGRWTESPNMKWDAVPPRVEGVIEKRIGRLEPNQREILAVAAVEGEEFTAQVVARVQQIPERQALQQLSRELGSRHRLVREQGDEAVEGRLVTHYRFAHALFQHYLYDRLSAGERRSKA